MVRQHQVNTKHPRYQVPQYQRGQGSPSTPTWKLYQQYPDEPVNYFGTTRDPNQALWILSDGRMVSGSRDNINPWSDFAHMDIVQAYGMTPSGDEARRWQQMTGSIRMRRSSMAPDGTLNIEMYQKPSMAQMRTISRAVGREGTIYVDYWSGDGKNLISQRVRHAGELRGVLNRI